MTNQAPTHGYKRTPYKAKRENFTNYCQRHQNYRSG